jgi:CHAT domain-containing protein
MYSEQSSHGSDSHLFEGLSNTQHKQILLQLKAELEIYGSEPALLADMIDSDLGEKIRLLAHILHYYFTLVTDEIPSDTAIPELEKKNLFSMIPDYLLNAINTYHSFLRRTLEQQQNTVTTVINKASEEVTGWGERLVEQGRALREARLAEDEPRIRNMDRLTTQLKNTSTYLTEAGKAISTQGKRSPRRPGELLQALTSLSEHCRHIQQHLASDREQLLALSEDWPAEQREFTFWLTELLKPFPEQLANEWALIGQIQTQAEKGSGPWETVSLLSDWLDKWRSWLSAATARKQIALESSPFFQRLIQFYEKSDEAEQALLFSEWARAKAFADLFADQSGLSGTTRYAPDTSLTLEDIRAIAQQRHSTILEYFLAPSEQLIIWVVSPAGRIEAVTRVVKKDHLDKIVNRFLVLAQTPELARPERLELSDTLRKLYDYLIAPVSHLLPISGEETLIIVPHDSLLQVPFAALKKDAHTYFIEDYALVYAPSIDILRYTALYKKRVVHPDTPTLLAFVNPALPQEYPGRALVFSEQNFTNVAEFYGNSPLNKIYTGHAATKQALRQEAASCTVLCLITHAHALNARPLDSYLILADEYPGRSLQQLSFTATEAFELELHTDLVILAGCEVEHGEKAGAGIDGLSSAFIRAGASSLLLNLWPMPELESLEQLYLFHLSWKKTGTSKAQALRYAQIEALRSYPEQPDVWAAFVLIGEGSA